MKILIPAFILLIVAGGCSERSCQDKLAQRFKSNRTKLVQERSVHDFSISLSYFPAVLLPGADKPAEDKATSSYYYFRLVVDVSNQSTAPSGDRSALYYGIDSLFATGEGPGANFPVHVEPVMNGNNKKIEYLLVFDRAAFIKGEPLRIIFYDRLFTNTKMVFEFNRNNIDELESISC
jgi:hypothetical protein